MNCEASLQCWRYAYSRYFSECGYTEPPARDVLFFAGYVAVEMMPRGGIFAEQIPLPGDGGKGICPVLRGIGNSDCAEYAKYIKRKAQKERAVHFANKTPRVAIPKDVRRFIAARAKWRCEYCGAVQNSFRGGKKVRCVVEHVIPLALGGGSDASNLALSCRACNSEKGTQIWKRDCKKPDYESK